jgi:hypothetical protein
MKKKNTVISPSPTHLMSTNERSTTNTDETDESPDDGQLEEYCFVTEVASNTKSQMIANFWDRIGCALRQLDDTLNFAIEHLIPSEYRTCLYSVEPENRSLPNIAFVFPLFWPQAKLNILRALSAREKPSFQIRLHDALALCEQTIEAAGTIFLSFMVHPHTVQMRTLRDTGERIEYIVTEIEKIYTTELFIGEISKFGALNRETRESAE